MHICVHRAPLISNMNTIKCKYKCDYMLCSSNNPFSTIDTVDSNVKRYENDGVGCYSVDCTSSLMNRFNAMYHEWKSITKKNKQYFLATNSGFWFCAIMMRQHDPHTICDIYLSYIPFSLFVLDFLYFIPYMHKWNACKNFTAIIAICYPAQLVGCCSLSVNTMQLGATQMGI